MQGPSGKGALGKSLKKMKRLAKSAKAGGSKPDCDYFLRAFEIIVDYLEDSGIDLNL